MQKKKVFHHTVSLGYGGEGCNPRNTYKEVTLEGWTTKPFWIFYHSREAPFVSNSTIFRHALLPSSFILEREREQQRDQQQKQNSTTTPSSSSVVLSLPERFQHQPVSIGYGLPPDQWIQEYLNSRFCLVIRGDQPGSTSLLRSIRMGCLPIVVSDSLPASQQLYPHVLQYEDFSVTVSEDDFLMNPIQSLDDAILFFIVGSGRVADQNGWIALDAKDYNLRPTRFFVCPDLCQGNCFNTADGLITATFNTTQTLTTTILKTDAELHIHLLFFRKSYAILDHLRLFF